MLNEEILEEVDYLVGLGSDGSEEGGAALLMARFVITFLFLVGTRGAVPPEIGLRIEAD